MTTTWFPCRIVTPEATYEPAHFRADRGQVGELLDKAGQPVASLDGPNWTLVYEAGEGLVRQRYQVTDIKGARWLVERIDHCGCGQTRVTSTNLAELEW